MDQCLCYLKSFMLTWVIFLESYKGNRSSVIWWLWECNVYVWLCVCVWVSMMNCLSIIVKVNYFVAPLGVSVCQELWPKDLGLGHKKTHEQWFFFYPEWWGRPMYFHLLPIWLATLMPWACQNYASLRPTWSICYHQHHVDIAQPGSHA